MPQHNTPQLRFPEFSGAWEEKKLGDIADIIDGDRGANYPNSSDFSQDGYCLFLNAKNVTKHGFSFIEKMFITAEKDAKLRKGKLRRHDIVLTTRGSIGNIAYYDESIFFENLRINSGMVLIRSKNTVIPNYLYIYFYTPNLVNNINQIAFGSAQPQLTVKEINKFNINFPTLPEQQKIALFLSAADKKLEQLQQKKTLLEQYKKGMMQKLFSQQIRFKDDEGKDFPEWEEVQLKDILYEHKERNLNKQIGEVFSVAKQKGVVNQIEHLGRSYAADDTSNYKAVYPFDVIYTKSPTSDFPFGIIKQNKTGRKGIVSTLYGVFTPKNQNIGLILDTYFATWENTYNYLNPLVQKGAKNTMNINNEDFLNGAYLKIPSSEKEQTKIANFLTAIDAKIAAVSAQVTAAKGFKKGLLQQMFV